jgi:hypothetical protein
MLMLVANRQEGCCITRVSVPVKLKIQLLLVLTLTRASLAWPESNPDQLSLPQLPNSKL